MVYQQITNWTSGQSLTPLALNNEFGDIETKWNNLRITEVSGARTATDSFGSTATSSDTFIDTTIVETINIDTTSTIMAWASAFTSIDVNTKGRLQIIISGESVANIGIAAGASVEVRPGISLSGSAKNQPPGLYTCKLQVREETGGAGVINVNTAQSGGSIFLMAREEE